MENNLVGTQASVIDTNMIFPIAEAFLSGIATPAFLWETTAGRIIKKNALAEEMFRRFNRESDFLGDFLQNWTKVRSFAYDTMWFEFGSADEAPLLVQVRNALIDAETDLMLSIVIHAQWADHRLSDQSLEGLNGLIRTASVTFLSRKDFIDNFETFLYRTTITLSLSSFNFIPAERIREYGLFEPAEKYAKNGLAYHVYAPFVDQFGRLNPGVLSNLQDLSERVPENFLVFPVPDGNDAIGWFVLVLYDNRNYSYDLLQSVMEVFSTFFQSLIDKIIMTKSLYQSDFENRLNIRIVDNVSEGIVITNQQFQIVYLNKIAAKIFGFTPKDIFGHQLEDLLVSNVSIRNYVSSSTENEESFIETPSVQYLHRRSGERFPCQIRFSKVRMNDENQYFIFVLSDITETEESRRKTEQLTHRAILGDFASMMAHEIRNPINNMKPWIQVIKSSAGKNDSMYNAACKIEDDCQRVSDIISNILNFSRPLKLNFELTDLGALIEVILERWKRDFASENIRCFFRKPEDFPKLYLDVKSIDQVLTNLIQNAVDAINHAGGILTLNLSTRPYGVSGRDIAVLSVSNTGPGIPDELIDHIFEPFITSKKNGNGWGLALTKRIIASHKGTIQVKSLTEGVVFEIFLPVSNGG